MAIVKDPKPLAAVVVGVHRSGTRLTTRILMNGGCQGSDQHRQPYDDEGPPPATFKPIVWRFGYPHSTEWPDLPEVCRTLRARGYEPHVVWIMRGPLPTWRSAVAAQMSWDEEEAEWMDFEGIARIVQGIALARVPCTRLLHPELVLHPEETIAWLYERLGLKKQAETEIYEADAKWYADVDAPIDTPSEPVD